MACFASLAMTVEKPRAQIYPRHAQEAANGSAQSAAR
jgi:hypothetical protein